MFLHRRVRQFFTTRSFFLLSRFRAHEWKWNCSRKVRNTANSLFAYFTDIQKIFDISHERNRSCFKRVKNFPLQNSPGLVVLYDGRGSCPKPGLIFLRIKNHYYVLTHENRLFIFTDISRTRARYALTPCTRALKDIRPGRMCWSRRIDIIFCRFRGIKCDNFAIPIRDKKKIASYCAFHMRVNYHIKNNIDSFDFFKYFFLDITLYSFVKKKYSDKK